MAEWHLPVDPDCPVVIHHYGVMDDDPMNDYVPRDVIEDINREFERKHRLKCERCMEFGCANVEVRY